MAHVILGTSVMAVAAALMPLQTRVSIVAGEIDLAFLACGVRLTHSSIRAADIKECAIRVDRSDLRSYLPWHRTPGCTAFCFAGTGVSLLIRGYSEVLIGSADPRRLAAAINAARKNEEPAAEPLGSDVRP